MDELGKPEDYANPAHYYKKLADIQQSVYDGVGDEDFELGRDAADRLEHASLDLGDDLGASEPEFRGTPMWDLYLEEFCTPEKSKRRNVSIRHVLVRNRWLAPEVAADMQDEGQLRAMLIERLARLGLGTQDELEATTESDLVKLSPDYTDKHFTGVDGNDPDFCEDPIDVFIDPTQEVNQMTRINRFRFEHTDYSLSTDGTDENITPDEFMQKAGFVYWNIHTNRVVNMTAKGKMPSFKALVVAGNRMGTAGYGVGKGANVAEAVDRAVMDTRKNLIYLDLHEGRTIWEPLVGKHNSTKAILFPFHKYGGLKVGRPVFAVCDCFGIQDLGAKLIGRANPYSQMMAIFDAFQSFRTMDDMARARGRRIYQVRNLSPQYVRNL